MHPRKCVPQVMAVLCSSLLLLGAAAFPAAAQEPPTGRTLFLAKGATQELQHASKKALKDVRSENADVATVTRSATDFKVVFVTGKNEGTTRVTLIDVDNLRDEVEVVVGKTDELRRQDIIKLIRQHAPTANVQATVTGNTVVLSGTVAEAKSVQVIMELARSVYQGGTPLIINDMRIGGVQQVQLDVIVARVNRSEIRNMTFNFLDNEANHFAGSILKTPQSLASALTPAVAGAASSLALSGGNLPFGFFTADGSHGFIGFLEALRTEGLAKFMASPSVTTLSGRPAYISSGGEVPVLTASGTGGPTVQYKQFGTLVNCLPIVLGNGKIYLEVRPEVSTRNAALDLNIAGQFPTSIPGFDSRSAQVTVMLEDGQTLAIGGLIQHAVNATTSKIPVLGDLPILGAAFRSTSYSEAEEELLILVTPRLVDPLACCQLPKYLPGQETRSPSDFELFLEGILEAPRGPRDITFGHKMYQGAHMQGPMADKYPCGGLCGNGTCGVLNGNGISCGNGGCIPGSLNGYPGLHSGYNGSVLPAPRVSMPPAARMPAMTPAFPGLTPAPLPPMEGDLPAVPAVPQGDLPGAATGPMIPGGELPPLPPTSVGPEGDEEPR